MCLVDRSYSMKEPLGGVSGNRSLAETVADVLNDFISQLAVSCMIDPNEGVRPYYFVGLVGYGVTEDGRGFGVEPLFRDKLGGEFVHDINDISMNYLRIEERAGDPASGMPAGPAEVWVEPAYGYGTPMCEALYAAGQIVQRFCEQFPRAFPPVVFNFTDGEPTDEESFEVAGQSAAVEEWAERLKSLGTADGDVLLFNALISAKDSKSTQFPSSANGLSKTGLRLFNLSSEIPETMRDRAREAFGWDLPRGSRGLVVNATASDLSRLFSIGTPVFGQINVDG